MMNLRLLCFLLLRCRGHIYLLDDQILVTAAEAAVLFQLFSKSPVVIFTNKKLPHSTLH